jgi:hypothetical protein
VAHYNALMFNWSASLGAWALGGPAWGVIVFLGIALARVSIEAQGLRHEAALLRRRLVAHEGPFAASERDFDWVEDSQVRLRRPEPPAAMAASA